MSKIGKFARFWTPVILAAVALGIALIIQAVPSAVASSPAGLSGPCLEQGKPKPCCIAGKYNGTREGVSGTCPEPKIENFTMQISQGDNCDSSISGTIVGDSDPTQIQKFTGTVMPSSNKGCCELKGKFTTATETTEFQGTLCRKGNKWSATGTYKSTDANGVCSGTWKMTEI
jgi:hypothetical protein